MSERQFYLSFMRRLARDVRGATAVEFGLVCVPFLGLLGAILQVAFSIWAAQNFDFVFQKTARSLFTGQFQQSNSQSASAATLLAALKSSMCGTSPSVTVFDCSSVRLDISLGTNFASITPATPVDAATRDWSSGFGTHYTCPGPGTIVVATAAAKFPVFFGLLNVGFSSFSDGSQLLMSTAVFRTEPYSVGSPASC